MTDPQFDNTAARDALLEVGRMLSGSKMLQEEPGVVYSLAAAKARPQDAQAIDQFMQELDAEKQVYLARQSIASGQNGYINLTDEQRGLLDGMGFKYDDVLYTSAGAASRAKQQVEQATNDQLTVKTNPDGTLATNSDGSPVLVKVAQAPEHHSGSGWFHSPGSFFGHLGGSIATGAKAALGGMGKGLNFTLGAVSKGWHYLGYEVTHPSQVWNSNTSADLRHQMDPTSFQDMQQQGYDPNSFWSAMAFTASGHSHNNFSELDDQYGADLVNKALQFQKNPKAFRDAIIGNQSNYLTTADGQTVLTPEASAQLQQMDSEQFQTLVRKLGAHTATVGNDFANLVGIDPVKHPEAYAVTAGASNFIAAFALDPTLGAFKGLAAAKSAAIGYKDAESAASILTRSSKLPWVNSVQRGWQRGIDLGQQIRAASLAGDTVQAGKLTAQFRAELPALEPVLDNFVGLHAFDGYEKGQMVFRDTGGFKDLNDAADFIRSGFGLQRLMVGKAAVQGSLMPGTMSAFGVRKLKGLTAGWVSARSSERVEKAYSAVLSKAQVDEGFRQKWLDEGFLKRVQPEANDAVDTFGDLVLSAPQQVTEEGLASAERGQLALTRSGAGEAARNLRAVGDPTGLASRFGWASPTAIAARSRLAAARWANLLPRNSTIDITDAVSGEKINKWARLYLDRGTASQFEAAWNSASMGQRKVILDGLLDQVAHASGITKSESGTALYSRYRTEDQAYSAAGNDILLNGRPVALAEGQTTTRFSLPSFEELYREASKLGLWDSTFGRALTSKYADLAGNLWKFTALFAPKTVTRNYIEGGLRTALEGEAGAAIKARAVLTTPHEDLWKLGYGQKDLELYQAQRGQVEGLQRLLADKGLSAEQRANANDQLAEAKRLMSTVEGKPVVQHLLATEAGDTAKAREIARGSMLSGDLTGRSKLLQSAADVSMLSKVGRAYRSLVLKHMDQADLDALMEMSPDDWAALLHGYRRQMVEDAPGLGHAANEATVAAQNGFGSATFKWTLKHEVSKGGEAAVPHSKRWTLQPLDDTLGADKYSNALGRLTANQPETTRAIMRALLAPEDDPAAKTQALQDVVTALEAESRHSDFGHAFFPDPINDPRNARTALNDEEREAGKLDWADKLIAEFRHLVTGQNGVRQDQIVDYLLTHGTAPDGDWIAKHIRGLDRPEAALAPETMALPAGGFDKLLPALQDRTGAAFAHFVERPLQRLMSSPVLAANFAKARKALNADVERLIAEHGFSEEAANSLARDLAMRNAMVHTEQLIDDPGQKTQFDVVARNFFPFSRAVQAMIRRWVPGLWRNPVAARKLMLAYESAVHSGMIYTNEYGEPTFTYPGSGAMGMALREIAKIPGLGNIAAFPISSDMTGGTLMAVPGADNPFRMSMGPMVSIPIREVYKHLLPTAWQGEALSLDRLINGPIGAGQTFNQLVPSAVRRFYEVWPEDGRNSAIASAMNAALANLAAAGYVPAPGDASTPSVRQQFFDRVKMQTRNQLFLRAALGMFAPAAPSLPSEGTFASGPDFAFSFDGLKQLGEEYHAILNETNGNVAEANAVFTALHPDELVYRGTDKHPVWELPSSAYETAKTEMNAAGAYVPSTTGALDWLVKNQGFVKQYRSVAAYFLPAVSTSEPFNDAAYQEQLQLGLRIRKVPTEFLDDVYVKHAEQLYYPSVQKFDALITQAKLENNDALASQYADMKSAWERDFKAINPLFQGKMDGYGDNRRNARAQLKDLQQMVKSGDTPDGYGDKLALLLKTWNDYETFIRENKGDTQVAKDARSQAFAMVNQWAQQQLAGTPLAAVFNGVFRALDSNLSPVATP